MMSATTRHVTADVLWNSTGWKEQWNVTPASVPPSVIYAETIAADSIVLYVFPLIVLFGTIGNVTSIMVLMQRRMRTTSVYFFLVVLAVADTLVLYISALKTWIRAVTEWELMVHSSVTCKLVVFLVLSSQHVAAWTIVLVTVDRFIAVWFPLRATSWCTLGRAYLGTAVTALAVIAYSLHSFWTFDIRAKPPARCLPAPDAYGHTPPFMNGPFQSLMVITYSALPFFIILVLNVSIVVRLRCVPSALMAAAGTTTVQQRPQAAFLGNRANMAAVSGANSVDNRAQGAASRTRAIQQTRVTYMLLTVSFFYLLLTSPYAFYSLFVKRRSTDPHTSAIHHLIKTVFFLLMYLNHSINFILYCVTGRKFRRELKELLVCLCCTQPSVNSPPSVKTMRSNCIELEPLNNEHLVVTSPEVQRHRAQRRYDTSEAIPSVAPFDEDSSDEC